MSLSMPERLDDPHRGQPVAYAGKPLGQSPVVVIMIHGRGASADNILSLAQEFQRSDLTYLAPQAAGNTWYPTSFLSPLAQNEPYLSSALGAIADLVTKLNEAGIPSQQIVLLGFSQGACLATEFAARNAQRYGGIVGLSGGLIGPVGTPRNYAGTLDGTPVFLGCSDVDAHIPAERVNETAQVLGALGGQVTARLYPGMGHTINQDELAHVIALLDELLNDLRTQAATES